jgi:hypothetical protein
MDEEIKSATLEIINNAQHLAIEHAPAVIQDILLWAKVQVITPLLFTAILLVLTIRFSRKAFPKYDLEDPCLAVATIFSGSALVVSTIITVVVLFNALHAWVAPYSYLVSRFM